MRMRMAMSAGIVGLGTMMAGAQVGTWDTKLGDPLHIWVGNPDAAKGASMGQMHIWPRRRLR